MSGQVHNNVKQPTYNAAQPASHDDKVKRANNDVNDIHTDAQLQKTAQSDNQKAQGQVNDLNKQIKADKCPHDNEALQKKLKTEQQNQKTAYGKEQKAYQDAYSKTRDLNWELHTGGVKGNDMGDKNFKSDVNKDLQGMGFNFKIGDKGEGHNGQNHGIEDNFLSNRKDAVKDSHKETWRMNDAYQGINGGQTILQKDPMK